MCGVDKSDQMMAYMPLQRRSMKWWKKVFIHLFTLTLVQCHILYNKTRTRDHKPVTKLHDFIIELGIGLKNSTSHFQEYSALPPLGVGSSTPDALTDSQIAGTSCIHSHFSTRTLDRKMTNPEEDVLCVRKSGGLIIQIQNNSGQMTYFWCKECEAPLCPGLCFEHYHTKEKYWL